MCVSVCVCGRARMRVCAGGGVWLGGGDGGGGEEVFVCVLD